MASCTRLGRGCKETAGGLSSALLLSSALFFVDDSSAVGSEVRGEGSTVEVGREGSVII